MTINAIKNATVNDMKSTTTYDKLNRKNIIKVGETWMHGSLGVVTIDRIYRRNNKTCTTTVLYTDKKGIQWASICSYVGGWKMYCNLLFKVA